ncbi:MAG: hypothetical protein IJ880_02545 [Bacilli bacterium]|nr:hypothetical protein [Bacilli bacterium]
MVYEYIISMVWHSKESNSTSNSANSSFTIAPEKITGFAIISDYDQTNMPIAYATLNLNKTDRDRIIKEAKTAYFDLNITTVQIISSLDNKTSNAPSKYSGKCVYFIDEDLNYNKELDYPEKTAATALKSDNDVLQAFSVGLMWDKCIENNKQTSNDTILNTTMFNAVLRHIGNKPLLIEPFKYNETLEQLIVPPKESLSKVIEFFNDVKVFYETKYRFFIDPDCIYLTSSSGKGIKKKGEKFVNWVFNVRPITDPASMKEGMAFNSQNNCYYTDIHVKDTYYTIDNDTNKLFNEIKSIVDPNINNTPPWLDSINQAISSVNQLTNTINSSLNSTVEDICKIPNTLSNFRCSFIENASILNYIIKGNDNNPGRAKIRSNSTIGSIETGISELQKMENTPPMSEGGEEGIPPTPKVDPEEWKETILEMIKLLGLHKNNINNTNTYLQGTPDTFKEDSKDVNSLLSGVTNLPGYMNSVTAINASDNVDNMRNKASNLTNKASTILANAKQFESELKTKSSNIHNDLNKVIDILSTGQDMWDLANPPKPSEDGSTTEEEEKINPFDALIASIKDDKAGIISCIGVDENGNTIIPPSSMSSIKPLVYMTQQYSQFCNVPQQVLNNVTPIVGNIKARSEGIKSAALGTWNAIQNVGKTAQQCLDKITGMAKDISAKVKSLDFNIKSLPDLQRNINTIKDIAGIGMLGISMFRVDLSISGGGRSTGDKIIKVKNDNNNAIKNIKSEIETYSNKISISKTGLDIDTFTINKQYVIKNYNAHSNKNGVFLLIKKSDFFVRAADKFTVSTQLEFAKIADEIDKNGNPKSAIDTSNDVLNLLRHAESIVSIGKSGINLDNASSVILHANEIQKLYEKISKPGSTGKAPNVDIDQLIIH